VIGLSATLIVARTRLPRVHGSVLLRITGWPGSAKRVQQRQGPVSMGPRAQTVVDAVALRLALLEGCEHLQGDVDLTYWIATRPSRLLCAFCWQAAQVMGEPRCRFCDAPAGRGARHDDCREGD